MTVTGFNSPSGDGRESGELLQLEFVAILCVAKLNGNCKGYCNGVDILKLLYISKMDGGCRKNVDVAAAAAAAWAGCSGGPGRGKLTAALKNGLYGE